MSRQTYEQVRDERAARPARFPPKDLYTCQQRLREVQALLEHWKELGKADGLHGDQLRAVLSGQVRT